MQMNKHLYISITPHSTISDTIPIIYIELSIFQLHNSDFWTRAARARGDSEEAVRIHINDPSWKGVLLRCGERGRPQQSEQA